MWFQTQREDGSLPAGFVSGAIGELARLLAAIQDMVLPQQIYVMPFLDDGTIATEAAREVGRTDGRNLDDLTRTVRTSNLSTVAMYVQELLEVVGQRANAVLAAQKAGTLTEEFQPSAPLTGWRAASLRTKLLMLVAFVLEAVFGAKMAERLAGSEDAVSWLVGVAIALLLTSSALAIAQAIHEQELGLVRGRGAWIALAVAAVAIAFLTIYAFGLGGGADGAPTSGGLSGGDTPGSSSVTNSSENWVLVLVYCGLLLLLLSAVVLSHLIDLYVERVARVGVDVGIRARVLSPVDQKRLAIRLLYHCLGLKDQAKLRALGLLSAYVGGVRSVLPPAVNAGWDTTQLESMQIADPGWVPRVQAEIARLEAEVGDLGPEPPIVLTSVP